MADIITLEKVRNREKAKKELLAKKEKWESLRRFMRCANCHLRCSRCGVRLDNTIRRYQPFEDIPYSLCNDCLQEYNEYKERVAGKKIGEEYWYNEEWMEVWRTWLAYQDALKKFRFSKEFIELIEELRRD